MTHIFHAAQAAGAWIQANPGWSSIIVTYLLMAAINTAGKYPKAAGLIPWMRKGVDLVAPWTHAESGGTWKPPLFTLVRGEDGVLKPALSFSKPLVMNGTNGTKPSGFIRLGVMCALAAVGLALVLGLAVSGCTPTGKKVALDLAACGIGKGPAVVGGLVNQAIGSLTNAQGAPSWEDFSKTTLLSQGIDLATCVVLAAVHDLQMQIPAHGQAEPRVLEALEKARDWLAEHKVQAKLRSDVRAQLEARRL